MSTLYNVTFIGGSANLTQRVLKLHEVRAPHFDVAVMPDLSPMNYQPGYEPEMVHSRRERYELRQVGRHHYVALYEHLAR